MGCLVSESSHEPRFPAVNVTRAFPDTSPCATHAVYWASIMTAPWRRTPFCPPPTVSVSRKAISPLLAALSEPISIAYSAVLKAGPLLGRTVAVIGPGPIGYLIALLASLSGAARVTVLGLPKDRDRLDRIRQHIDRSETFDDLPTFQAALSDRPYSPGADVVFEVTGAAKGAQLAMEAVAKLGQVVLVGIVSDAVSLNTNIAVRSEVLLAGSAAASKAIWMRMLNHLAHLSEAEKNKFEQVVTHRFPLAQALKAFALMESGVGLKMMLTSVED